MQSEGQNRMVQSGCVPFENIVSLLVVALFALGCTTNQEKNQQVERDDNVARVSENDIITQVSREDLTHRLADERFDILVIGGGATGAGAALDAATRGLSVALIEAQDFSAGTSSRSTKLVHGGVRYLEDAIKHFDFAEYDLVRDALHERINFLHNAPQLTRALPIITPVYNWVEAGYYLIGLKLYDFLAGDASIGHSQFLSRKKALARFPYLKAAGLKGAVMYFDGQFDDARMNVTLILSALRQGAAAANYVRVIDLIKENGMVVGAKVIDELTQKTWPIYAKIVINATGSFADSVRKLDNPETKDMVTASQGSHILLSEKFAPRDFGLIIPKTEDGRVIFLLPWLGKTLAGTTDQPHAVTEFPKATNEEVDYIIEHVQRYLDQPLSRKDVLASWSGIRPLLKPHDETKTAAISREHVIEVSPSHLVTIVGGKWTTYRQMAEDVVTKAIETAKLTPKNDSMTKDLKLVGARFYQRSLAEELVAHEHLPVDVAQHLASSYGDRVDIVIDTDSKSRRARLIEGYPFIEAEVIYTVHHEYAVHATDVLARRLRLAFLDNQAARKALPKVIKLMAHELKWSAERQQSEKTSAEQFLDTMLTKSPL